MTSRKISKRGTGAKKASRGRSRTANARRQIRMPPQCMKCRARCCRYFCLPIDRPETYEDFENIRWYLMHEGVTAHIDLEGDWYVLVDSRCGMLKDTPRGPRCAGYAARPLVCRRFSPESCDFTRGGFECEEYFSTPRQLEAYARRMLGRHAYSQARSEARSGAKRPRPDTPA